MARETASSHSPLLDATGGGEGGGKERDTTDDGSGNDDRLFPLHWILVTGKSCAS